MALALAGLLATPPAQAPTRPGSAARRSRQCPAWPAFDARAGQQAWHSPAASRPRRPAVASRWTPPLPATRPIDVAQVEGCRDPQYRVSRASGAGDGQRLRHFPLPRLPAHLSASVVAADSVNRQPSSSAPDTRPSPAWTTAAPRRAFNSRCAPRLPKPAHAGPPHAPGIRCGLATPSSRTGSCSARTSRALSAPRTTSRGGVCRTPPTRSPGAGAGATAAWARCAVQRPEPAPVAQLEPTYLMTGMELDNQWSVNVRSGSASERPERRQPRHQRLRGPGRTVGVLERGQGQHPGPDLAQLPQQQPRGSARLLEWMQTLGGGLWGARQSASARPAVQRLRRQHDRPSPTRKRTVFTVGLSLVDFDPGRYGYRNHAPFLGRHGPGLPPAVPPGGPQHAVWCA